MAVATIEADMGCVHILPSVHVKIVPKKVYTDVYQVNRSALFKVHCPWQGYF